MSANYQICCMKKRREINVAWSTFNAFNVQAHHMIEEIQRHSNEFKGTPQSEKELQHIILQVPI